MNTLKGSNHKVFFGNRDFVPTRLTPPPTPSVPNSSDKLIFVKRRALFGQKYERTDGQNSSFVILSSFCGLVHAQSIVDLFAKLLNNAQNVPIITERRAKSQKYGRQTGDFPQMPVQTGNSSLDSRLIYTELVSCHFFQRNEKIIPQNLKTHTGQFPPQCHPILFARMSTNPKSTESWLSCIFPGWSSSVGSRQARHKARHNLVPHKSSS